MPAKLRDHRFKSTDIKLFLNQSRKHHTKLFTCFYLKDTRNRIAIITPKRLGGAVQRHKIQRKLKETIRLNFDAILTSQYSLIIVAKTEINNYTFKIMHSMLLLSLRKLGIIHESSDSSSN